MAVSGNLAYTERAPTFYELYANGVHVATVLTSEATRA